MLDCVSTAAKVGAANCFANPSLSVRVSKEREMSGSGKMSNRFGETRTFRANANGTIPSPTKRDGIGAYLQPHKQILT